jgi:hypothetical protein
MIPYQLLLAHTFIAKEAQARGHVVQAPSCQHLLSKTRLTKHLPGLPLLPTSPDRVSVLIGLIFGG